MSKAAGVNESLDLERQYERLDDGKTGFIEEYYKPVLSGLMLSDSNYVNGSKLNKVLEEDNEDRQLTKALNYLTELSSVSQYNSRQYSTLELTFDELDRLYRTIESKVE